MQASRDVRIGKDLVAASAMPLVLAILDEGDSYGYAILKRINELSGGGMEWTDGMLYPLLHRLDRLGYVEARWDEPHNGRRRRYYAITPSGRSALSEQRRQWEVVSGALHNAWHSVSSPGSALAPAGA
jgi:DNA-binding PadR family transcriptional regulator